MSSTLALAALFDAPHRVKQLEEQLAREERDMVYVRERLESEVAMRLFYQHRDAAGRADQYRWDMASEPERDFWRGLAHEHLLNTL